MSRWTRHATRGEALYRVAAGALVIALCFALIGITRGTQAASQVSSMVSASADDARLTDTGAFTSTETTTLVGAGNGSANNVNGFRFAGVNVPKGAVITSARVTLVKDRSATSRLVVDCAFEASDNAAAFSVSSTPAQRSRTAAHAHYDANMKRVNGKRYDVCNATELAASLQEVVNRPNWRSGNSLVVIADGPASPAMARADFRTRDSGSRVAPSLIVSYDLAPATATPVTPTATSTPITPTATPVTPTATPITPTATPGTGTGVAGQPCPTATHDAYKAAGPDGAMYATWHPSTDPATGCHFGHEHGDDPTGSPALRGRNVVFGYASTRAGMTEPHAGFKVAVWNQEKNTHNTPNSHMNAWAIWVVHQGTGGAARFNQPFHDLQLHYYNPDDGREVHAYVLGNFADTVVRGAACGTADKMIANNPGSGSRQIAGPDCFADGFMSGKQYEDWITAVYLGEDSSGNWKAYFDPHFAIFNPNTYCDLQADNTCKLGYSDTALGTGQDPASTSAWFKGDHRETYLNQVWIKNSGGSTSIWTDPYGKLVAPGSANAIEQYVAAMYWEKQDPSNAFGADRNHDPDGSVHAPN